MPYFFFKKKKEKKPVHKPRDRQKIFHNVLKNPKANINVRSAVVGILRSPLPRLKKCFRLEALTFPRKKHYHVLQKFEIRAKFSYASDGPDKLATHLAHASKGKILHHVISMMGIPQFFWWIIYFFFQFNNFFSNSPILVRNRFLSRFLG